jgi:hypothetical protein
LEGSAGRQLFNSIMQRYFPVRVYILDDHLDLWDWEELRVELWISVHRLLSTVEIFYLFELPPEKGSWKKVSGAISRWFGTEADGERRMRQLEEAAKTVLLDKPTAEVSKLQADAAGELIDKLKDYDGASVMFGNMALAKYTTADGRKLLIAGPLSPAAMKQMEQNQIEQMKPENAFKLIEDSGRAVIVHQEHLRLPLKDEEQDR